MTALQEISNRQVAHPDSANHPIQEKGEIQFDALEMGVVRTHSWQEALAKIQQDSYFALWNPTKKRWNIYQAVMNGGRRTALLFQGPSVNQDLGFEPLFFNGTAGSAERDVLQDAVVAGLAVLPSEAIDTDLPRFWLLLNKPSDKDVVEAGSLKVGDRYYTCFLAGRSDRIVLQPNVVKNVGNVCIHSESGQSSSIHDPVLVDKVSQE